MSLNGPKLTVLEQAGVQLDEFRNNKETDVSYGTKAGA